MRNFLIILFILMLLVEVKFYYKGLSCRECLDYFWLAFVLMTIYYIV